MVGRRRRQQPGDGRRLPGRLQRAELDRRAALGEVLLPARVRRHRGHDRLRRRRRAHQVRRRSSSSASCWSASIYPIVGHWIWGGGWLATAGHPFRLRRLDRRALASAAGRRWRASSCSGPRIGKYGTDGKVNADPRPQHGAWPPSAASSSGSAGSASTPARTMAADAGAIGHIAVTTNTAAAVGAARRDAHRLAPARQARPQHDPQRLPRRPGRHHRPVRVRQRRRLARSSARSPACSWSSPCCSSTRSKLDDPVGATSVHLVERRRSARSASACSPTRRCVRPRHAVQGRPVLSAAARRSSSPQLIGIVAVGAFVFVAASATWCLLKADDRHPRLGRRGDRRPRHRRARHGGLPRLPPERGSLICRPCRRRGSTDPRRPASTDSGRATWTRVPEARAL